MSINLTKIEKFVPNEDFFLTIPKSPGKIWVRYENRQDTPNEHNAFVNQRVPLDEAREFTQGSIPSLRRLPRYHARRFNLWHWFDADPEYVEYLKTLTNNQCRAIDRLEAIAQKKNAQVE